MSTYLENDEYDGTEACFKCSKRVSEYEWHEDCGLCAECCTCPESEHIA